MLLGEQWVLKSRYLYLDPPEEYKVQPRLDTRTSTRTSTPQVPEQVGNMFHTENDNIVRLVRTIGTSQMSVKQMMEAIGLKHRPNFIEYSLNPAIREGFVRMLYPDSLRHPRQKYLLTVKGMGLYDSLNNK